jgi:hypothetical protein
MPVSYKTATRCAHVALALTLVVGFVLLAHQAFYKKLPQALSNETNTIAKDSTETKNTAKGKDVTEKHEVTTVPNPNFVERVLGRAGLWVLRVLLVLLAAFVVGALVQRSILGNFALKVGELELPVLPEAAELLSLPLPAADAFKEENANSSSVMSMLETIKGHGVANYALIDLGTGQSWLTTRLFIFATLMRRMRALKTLVFVETRAGVDNLFLGLMHPDAVRWRLAREYSWLEPAFAGAYSKLQNLQIRSELGALDFGEAGLLVQNFLGDTNITIKAPQKPAALPVPQLSPQPTGAPGPAANPPPVQYMTDDSWVPLKSKNWEHARWLNRTLLERLLDISPRAVAVVGAGNLSDKERSVAALACEGPFVALVDERRRFRSLLDRETLLQRLSLTFLSLSTASEDAAQRASFVVLPNGALLPKHVDHPEAFLGPEATGPTQA